MPFGKHIIDSRILMDIRRYQNKYMHKPRSVAEHSWSVAKIAQGLALWEITKFDNEVDMGELLQRAINHDIVEIYTGDILSQTKRKTKEMKEAIERVEEMVFAEDILPDIPKSWRLDFGRYILNPKADGSIEAKILTASDIIDTIYEAADEIRLGNHEGFDRIIMLSTEALMEIGIDSVRYFIKYSLQDLGLDIKEVFGERVFNYMQTLDFSDKF